MFRAKQSPIIRSSIKLYLQHLTFINRVWPAVVVDESEHVSGDLQELIKYCTRVSSRWNFLELIHDALNDEHNKFYGFSFFRFN
jgi:hypothetical protein